MNEKVERAEHASCTLKRDGSKGEKRGLGVGMGIPALSNEPNHSTELAIRSGFQITPYLTLWCYFLPAYAVDFYGAHSWTCRLRPSKGIT